MEYWNLGYMDVSGRVLATWMPAIHAGMTMIHFMFLGERSIMNHFVVALTPVQVTRFN